MRITSRAITLAAAAAPLVAAASLAISRPAAAQTAPAAETSAAAALVGKRAPEFTLPDQNNQSRSLSGHRGKWVVLAFYPADKTRG